jgi:hypothetical protein
MNKNTITKNRILDFVRNFPFNLVKKIMKTLIFLIVSILMAPFIQAEIPNNYIEDCHPDIRICGGVITVVTVATNTGTGHTVVLPVKIKMLPDVENNPFWHWPLYFGSNVTILPPQNVKVISLYPFEYTIDNKRSHYSHDYPIYIQSTTNGYQWKNEFYFTLRGISSKIKPVGACQASLEQENSGFIEAALYDGSNTNGFNIIGGTAPSFTNSIMERFGMGSCHAENDNSESRESVCFIFFNLPPKKYAFPDLICQPGTNYFDHLWFAGFDTNGYMLRCGFPLDYEHGFVLSDANEDYPQNWPFTNAPCPPYDVTKTYRVFCGGASEKIFQLRREGNNIRLISWVENCKWYAIYAGNNIANMNSWKPLTCWNISKGEIQETVDYRIFSPRFYQLRILDE